MLRFDDAAARHLEAMYSTPDVIAQRRWTRQALNLRPGESVVDVGSGPGLLAAEMALDVGPTGRIMGVDAVPDMMHRPPMVPGIAMARCGRRLISASTIARGR